MALSLRVVLPFGCDEKEKTFKCQSSDLVSTVVDQISNDQRLKDGYLRTLYCPANKQYLNPESPLSSYKLSEKVKKSSFDHFSLEFFFFKSCPLIKFLFSFKT